MNYEKLMKKCIKLAQKAEGDTGKNPLVGAILIDDDEKIISCGYHQKYGEAHAEVNAIKNANGDTKNKILVVNLEPCSHYGKTPPCADLIIKSGIKKVIIGTKDVNPIVAGNGIKKLKDAGIEVVCGVLEDECRQLNEIFFKNQIEKKIFVSTKIGQTLDGKIALSNGISKWITSEKSRKIVQKIRYKHDAILTSAKTVIADNPSLNIRNGKNKKLIRVILDKDLECPINAKVFNEDGAKIYVFCQKNNKKLAKHINIVETPLKNNHLDLQFILNYLFEQGIMSVLIETGGQLNNAFLQENLIDKMYLFIAPKIFGDKNAINSFYGDNLGNIANCVNLKIVKTKFVDPDVLLELKKNNHD